MHLLPRGLIVKSRVFFIALVLSGAFGGCVGRAFYGEGGWTPEQIVRGFDRKKLSSREFEKLRHPFVSYFACKALLMKNPQLCQAVDVRMPSAGENTVTCRKMYFQASMIEDAVSGSGAVDACVELARISEAGAPQGEADSVEEAEEFCRKLSPHYREGNAGRVCDFMQEEDGEYGRDDRTGRSWSREECVNDNLFLKGDVKLCLAKIGSVNETHCRWKAALVASVRSQQPRIAQGTPYAPLVGAGGTCAAFGHEAIEQYKQIIKRKHE